MSRCVSMVLCCLAWICAIALTMEPTANAQTNPDKIKSVSQTANKLKKGAVKVPATGYTIAPGVVVTTTTFTEGGYDSNPDQTYDEPGSGYLRSGVGLGLTAIGERTVANLTLSGSWLHLGDNIPRQDRLDGSVGANFAHLLAHGLTVSGGGLFSHNASTFSEDETAGAFAELTYENQFVSSFLRGRFIDVSYLSELVGNPPSLPAGFNGLLNPSSFDLQRSEVSGGVLVSPAPGIGLYGELNAALVDYVEQPSPTVVNRDGEDYYAKTGVRLAFSRDLTGDFGWRWNRRNVEDQRISSFSSNFFDASLTWKPSAYFWASIAIDRLIGEPSTPTGLLTDIRSVEFQAGYQPVDGVGLVLRASRQLIDEIGAFTRYYSTVVESELTYDYTTHMQFYTNLRAEFFEKDQYDQDYDRLRIGAGVRVAINGEDPLRGVGPINPIAHARGIRLPSGAELIVTTSYSRLKLPGQSMTTVVGDVFFDKAIRQIEDSDGDLDGVRTDVSLKRIAEHTLSNGKEWLSFGVAGFYARLDDTDHSHCDYTATTDCALVNIVDFDPNEENNTGPFGQLRTTTRRVAHYWGVAAEARFGGTEGTTAPKKYESPFKIGLAVRGINQRNKLHTVDPAVPDSADYKERLDTQYYGGYLGIEHQMHLGSGWSFTLDGTAGAYHSYTQYEGRYLAYVPTGGNQYVLEHGSIDDGSERTSFIGTIRLGLQQQISWASLGIYGQAEYLSYVPRVVYNNDDEAGGSPFGIVGTQVGTQLLADEAMSYSAGLSLTVPIQ